MCGIGGIYNRHGIESSGSVILDEMTAALAHRGPDGHGKWLDPLSGIGLCHTRLAVLDLSPRGAQPMTDLDGNGWIVYNGEVYNYGEIRRELEKKGFRFKSGTDSEVVLAACLCWGVEEALNRFIGMFAFALWIPSRKSLYLVRDRMGIKPLYYGWAGSDLVFGSELKALCAHPRFNRKVDSRALELYLMLQYIPSPRTIYAQARKLPPGHFMRLDPEGETVVKYWDPDPGESSTYWKPGEHGLSGFDQLLEDAVRSRLVSDVPLGAFLSGGMDSGLIAASMCRAGGGPPLTFNVSYAEADYDEGPVASDVASHLGTVHNQIRLDSRSLLERISDLPWIYDEPLSDPSALPMIVLSRFAREHATVILSGDGGDELFGGYDRYRFVNRFLNLMGNLPPRLRRSASALLGVIPARPLADVHSRYRKMSGRGIVENFPGKWEKLLKIFVQNDPASVYQVSIGIFSAAEAGAVLGREGAVHLPDIFKSRLTGPSELSFIRRMMDLDTRTFLTDDVLAKVDRASMATGLEVRVPFIDHRIVHWSRFAGDEALMEGSRGKMPLRKLAKRDLPPHIVNRPKMGFTMPLDHWLKGDLRDLLESYLVQKSGVMENYFDRRYVQQLITGHMSGRRNHHEKLWNLLVFALWEERWNPTAA
jgi:asparagine synthase (glutamine-hydrolysing)